MVISHKYRCVFVHIPKTAGSSMDRLLQGVDSDAVRIIPDLPATRIPAKGKHCFAADLAAYLPREIWNNYFKFAFVRNPFDRLVSWYSMCVQRPDGEYRRYILENTTDFASFVLKIATFEGRAQMVSFSQVDYINGEDQRPLLDFVGRFERLSEDFEQVQKVLGIAQPLPHFNTSQHRSYHDYYNPRLIGCVEDHFHRDLQQLEYEF